MLDKATIPGGMATADSQLVEANLSKSPNPKDLMGLLKPPLHLVPPVAIIEEAIAFADGARKYGPYNWRDHPVLYSVYHAAAMRHLLTAWDGEDYDPASQVLHLAHARACLAIMIDADACKCLIDDRPKRGDAAAAIQRLTKEKKT